MNESLLSHGADWEKEARRGFGVRLARLRKDRRWSQERLALESGLARSYLGGIERGHRNVSLVNIVRLALTLGVLPEELLRFSLKDEQRPSAVLEANREAVREVVSRYRTTNPRVFGSVLHGTDRDGSDIDILVDKLPGAMLFDLGGLHEDLNALLGVSVDVLTPNELPAKFRAQILAEAQPI